MLIDLSRGMSVAQPSARVIPWLRYAKVADVWPAEFRHAVLSTKGAFCRYLKSPLPFFRVPENLEHGGGRI
jgi:hypothetical protein